MKSKIITLLFVLVASVNVFAQCPTITMVPATPGQCIASPVNLTVTFTDGAGGPCSPPSAGTITAVPGDPYYYITTGGGTVTNPSSASWDLTYTPGGGDIAGSTVTVDILYDASVACPADPGCGYITATATFTFGAYAGGDIELCNLSSVALAGTPNCVAGNGTWTMVSATPLNTPALPFVAIDPIPAGQANVVVTNLSAGYTYVFAYTYLDGATTTVDEVTVENHAFPTAATAGPNQFLCNETDVFLAGNVATIGLGTWSIVSQPSLSPADPNSCLNAGTDNPTGFGVNSSDARGTCLNTLVTGGPAVYIWRWTITNGNCPPSFSDVTITDYAPPVPAIAPVPYFCGAGSTITLDGATGTTGDISFTFWTTTGTPFNIANELDPSTTYLVTAADVTAGSLTFDMAVTGFAPCTPVAPATITIPLDNVDPTITVCPPSQTADISDYAGCSMIVPDYTTTGTATDNCPGPITWSQSPAAGSTAVGPFEDGSSLTITVTATDQFGNSSDCSTTLIANDVNAPTITCPVDVTLYTDINCQNVIAATTYDATATDCSSTITYAYTTTGATTLSDVTSLVGAIFEKGITTVTWTASDNALPTANTATCSFTINVLDDDAPTVTAAADETINTSDDGGYDCVTAYTVTDATFDDNCPGFSLAWVMTGATTGSAAGQVGTATFEKGITTITYTVTDAALPTNLTATSVMLVTVLDDELPNVTGTADITTTTSADGLGNCNVAVAVTDATFGDNCPGSTLAWVMTGATTGAAAGQVGTATFEKGITTITYTVTDLATPVAFTATYEVLVTVTDDEDPIITVPSNYTADNDPGLCSAVVATAAPTYDDNCAVTAVYYTIDDASGTFASPTTGFNFVPASQVFLVGISTVTYFAEDAAGLFTSDNFLVTVNDVEDPIATCVANATRNANSNCTYTVAGTEFDATGTDNCSPITISWTYPAPPLPPSNSGSTTIAGAIFGLGANTVLWTVEDPTGNTATCTTIITVIDVTDPTIVCALSGTVSTDAGFCTYTVPGTAFDPTTVADNCDVTYENDKNNGTSLTGVVLPKGINVVTWTATDQSGNTKTCTVTITVNDTELPTIDCHAALIPLAINTNSGVCTYTNNAAVVPNATFADNCPLPTAAFSLSGATTGTGTTLVGVVFEKGVTLITWTVTDASLNTATCTQSVNVVDNQAPVVSNCTDKAVNTDATFCTYTVVGTGWDAIATDNCAVTSFTYTLSGVTTGTGTSLAGVSFNKGTTLVTWTAIDAVPFITTCTFNVVVTDAELPVITCNPGGNLAVSTDAGVCYHINNGTAWDATATDNCPSVTVAFVLSGATTGTGTTLDLVQFEKGITLVTWTATDGAGLQATCTYNVTVSDNENPTFATCPTDDSRFVDAGTCTFTNTGGGALTVAEAADNCPGVTINYVLTGVSSGSGADLSGQVFQKGATTVTWTATDAAGLTATCAFVVTVIDNIAPTVTCIPDAYRCTAPAATSVMVTDVDATYADNCPGVTLAYAVTGATVTTGTGYVSALFNAGVNTVTYTVTDLSMNTATCSFTVCVIATIEANAGPDEAKCIATSHTLVASDPGLGTGFWSYNAANTYRMWSGLPLVPATPVINPGPNQYTSTVSNLTPGYVYDFYYTVNSFGVCGNPIWYCSDTNEMRLTNWMSPITAVAGSDQFLCNETTATLTGNNGVALLYGSGNWTYQGATPAFPVVATPSIASPGSPVTSVSGLVPGHSYIFTYTTTNGPVCNPDPDNVTLYDYLPATSVAGGNQTVCPYVAPVNVSGTASNYTSIVWSTSGSGTFAPGNALVSVYTPTLADIAAGSVTLTLTAVANIPCPPVPSSLTITFADLTPPVITNCGDFSNVLVNMAANCSLTVPDLRALVTATDNCPLSGPLVITQVPAQNSPLTGPFVHNATTSVTLYATDANGNQSAPCTATLRAIDVTSPDITCAISATFDTDNGICAHVIVGTGLNATATDCSSVSYAYSLSGATSGTGLTTLAGVSFNRGLTAVQWTATDAAGNTDVCALTVTVVDHQAPTITCPSNAAANNTLGACNATVVTGTATTADNCEVNTLTWALSGATTGVSPTSGINNLGSHLFNVGTTVVTYTVADLQGNTTTCTFSVVVTDTELPTITCNPNYTNVNDAGLCSRSVTLIDPATSDNCLPVAKVTWALSGATTGTSATTGLNYLGTHVYNVGITNVLYTVYDATGNSASCTFTVTINDTEVPVIVCPADYTANNIPGTCAASVATTLQTPTDNCAVTKLTFTLSGATTDASPLTGLNYVGTRSFNVGVTTITYIASDVANNSSVCSFTVTVVDNEDPTMVCVVPATRNANVNCKYIVVGSEFDGIGNDNCPGWTVTWSYPAPPVPASDNGLTTLAGQSFGLGANTVMWTVTDASGNTFTCNNVITVIDINAPTITCAAGGSRNADAGVCTYKVIAQEFDPTLVIDNCNVTWVNNMNNAVSLAGYDLPVGNNVVIWTATDQSGNSSTCSVNVTVIDTQNPVISCASVPATVNTDANACTFTHDNTTSWDPTATDNCTVTTAYVLSGATVGSGSSLANVVFQKGLTIISWTATDASGRTAVCSNSVTVLDNQNPVITCATVPVTVDAGATCTYTVSGTAWNATVADNCPLATVAYVLSGVTSGSGSSLNGVVFNKGVTVVTWTATDAAGLTAVCSNTVNVIDVTAPVIACHPGGNLVVPANAGVCTYQQPDNSWDATATDNCSGVTVAYVLTGATVGTGTSLNTVLFGKGTTTVTWTATDASSNTAVCSFTVLVNDLQAPVFTLCPTAVTKPADAGVCTYTNPVSGGVANATATDNCITLTLTYNLTGVTSGTGTSLVGVVFEKGATTVTWTATDAGGLSTTCAYVVTVIDTELPTITCKANTYRCTAAAASSVVVNDIEPTAWADNCPNAVLSYVISGATVGSGIGSANGFTMNAGVNTVTYTVTDASSNVISCSFTVCVIATIKANAGPDQASCSTPNFVLVASDPSAYTPAGVGFWSYNQAKTYPMYAGLPLNPPTPVINPGPNQYTSTVSNLVAGYVYDFYYTVNSSGVCNNPLWYCTDTNEMRLTNWLPAVPSTAGADQFLCGATSTSLYANNGNALLYGTGSWTYVGATPTLPTPAAAPVIADASSPTTSVSNLTPGYTFVFTWTTYNGTVCPPNDDNVSIYDIAPATANAGSAQLVCPQVTSVSLTGAATNANSVLWTSSGTGTFSPANAVATTYYPTAADTVAGSVTLTLTATPGAPCQPVASTVVITFNDIVAPSFTSCPSAYAVNADAGVCTYTNATVSPAIANATATDNCVVKSLVYNLSGATTAFGTTLAGVVFNKGITTVTWTARDSKQNSATCVYTVTVTDNQAPAVSCVSNAANTDQGVCTYTLASTDITWDAAASDNCGTVTKAYVLSGATTGAGASLAGVAFNKGVTNVVWTATDAGGLTNVCSTTVTITDAELPSLACPGDVTQNTADGVCYAVVTGIDAVYGDNCPGSVLTYTLSGASVGSGTGQLSGTQFAKGVTVVTYNVLDASGNTANFRTCSFSVTVIDAQAPSMACPSNATANTAAGLCTAVVSGINGTANDNCPGVTYAYTSTGATILSGTGNASGSTFNKGVTVVTYTATDAVGLTFACSFTVTVNDLQAPVITACAAPTTLYVSANGCTVEDAAIGTITATDNCTPAGQIVISHLPVGPYTASLTPYTVTWKATDADGNFSTCSQLVTVMDTIKPVIACAVSGQQLVNTAPATCTYVQQGTGWDATASDNCVFALTYTLTGASVGSGVNSLDGVVFNHGITTVLWTAKDASNNFRNCSFTVKVVDVTPPSITCQPMKWQNTNNNLCYAVPVILTNPTVADNCSSLGLTITNNHPSTTYPLGATPVTWTVTDVDGNTNTCVQYVQIVDNQAPVLTCPAPITVTGPVGECTFPTPANLNLGTATVDDNCIVVSQSTDVPATLHVGVNTVTWSATDGVFNTGYCYQLIYVADLDAPVITCPPAGDQVVNVAAGLCTYTQSGTSNNATATDDCSETVTLSYTLTGVTTGTGSSLAGVVFAKGITTVTWKAVDASNNSNTCSFTMEVTDLIAPAFTGTPANLTGVSTVACSAVVTYATPAATDNCGTPTVVLLSGLASGSSFPVGVSTVVYKATDASGNTATVSFTVTVTDGTAPVISNCSDKIATVGSVGCYYTNVGSGWNATAVDPCGYTMTYALSGVTTGNGSSLSNVNFNLGVTTVNWTATDPSGNNASCSYTVTVNAPLAPTVICTGNKAVSTNTACDYVHNGTAWDATASESCSTVSLAVYLGDVTNVANTSLNGAVFNVGETTVVWVATDAANHTSTCSFIVTVSDNQSPTIACAPSASYNAPVGSCGKTVVLDLPTVSDNCTVLSVTSVPASGTMFPIGATTVVWTVLDNHSHSATCSNVIYVFDVESPLLACPGNVSSSTSPVTAGQITPTTMTDNCASPVLTYTRTGATTGSGTGVTPLVYNTGITTVTYTATDASGNFSTCSFTVTIGGGAVQAVSGKMLYNNIAGTPMNDATVNLIQGGTVVATATTNADGSFGFTNVPDGAYTLDGASSKPWGGANSTDALLAARHFTQLSTLNGLPLKAADVNGTGFVNSVDALLIAKRFVNLTNSFAAGDWAFETPAVTVNADYNYIVMKAECYGDINASYTPAAKVQSSVYLGTAGTMYVNSFSNFEMPINTTANLSAGAVSMVVNFPANLFDITGVKVVGANDAEVLYTVTGNELRMAWYNTEPIVAQADQAVLMINIKSKDLSNMNNVALELDGATEIADETGTVQNVNLTMPKLALAHGNLEVNVYPNPFNANTVFSYTLPEAASVTILVYDLVGNEVSRMADGNVLTSGAYTTNFDATSLKQGVYTYRMVVSSAKGEQVKTGRLVITR